MGSRFTLPAASRGANTQSSSPAGRCNCPSGTSTQGASSSLRRDNFQLVFAHLNVGRLRLAPELNAIDLHPARPKGSAEFNDLSPHPPRLEYSNLVSGFDRPVLLVGHRETLCWSRLPWEF